MYLKQSVGTKYLYKEGPSLYLSFATKGMKNGLNVIAKQLYFQCSTVFHVYSNMNPIPVCVLCFLVSHLDCNCLLPLQSSHNVLTLLVFRYSLLCDETEEGAIPRCLYKETPKAVQHEHPFQAENATMRLFIYGQFAARY